MLIKLAGKYNNCLTSPYADFCISIAGRRSNFLAACSRYQRNDKKVQTTTYLGRHIKDDLYYCKGDGYFRFNLETYEYIDIDDFFLNRESERLLKYQNCILNLDASYLIIQFLYSTGLIDVLDFFNKEDYDTFMTLLLSRIVTSKQITELNDWYNSSFLQLMYYRADVRLENCINFFSIIENDKYRSYFYKLYLEYISKNYRLDKNIIINCTEVSNIRLLYVANKSTEIPIFYAFPSKSASDIDSLPFMVEHMQKYGLKITDCIFDSGAYTSDNLDIFYDDKICAGIEYLILLNSDDENVRIAKEEFKNTIVSDTNRVKFENKILYVTEKEVYVGKNKNKKAFMYLCYNPSEDTNWHKNSQVTKTDTQITIDTIFNSITNSSYFAFISNVQFNKYFLILTYYKKYALEHELKLDIHNDSISVHTHKTADLSEKLHQDTVLNGSMFLSFIAFCIEKLIQAQLQYYNLQFVRNCFESLSQLHCKVINRRISFDPPQKEAKDLYDLLEINPPPILVIKDTHINIPHRKRKSQQTDFDGQKDQVDQKALLKQADLLVPMDQEEQESKVLQNDQAEQKDQGEQKRSKRKRAFRLIRPMRPVQVN